MAKKPKTQKTKQGETIRVPKRKDVFRDLDKVSNPKPKGKTPKDSGRRPAK